MVQFGLTKKGEKEMGYIEEDFDEAQRNLYGDFADPEGFDEKEYAIDGVGFADPGGKSALRAETKKNPRNLPCLTCKQPNRLTSVDRKRGYQCDECADRTEQGLDCY